MSQLDPMRISTISSCWFLFLCCAAGCGPGTISVDGIVVDENGKPAKDIRILFQGANSGPTVNPPSSALTDAEGRFVMSLASGRSGVIPGDYRVFLLWFDPEVDIHSVGDFGGKERPSPYDIPVELTDGSTLISVPTRGKLELKYEVRSEMKP